MLLSTFYVTAFDQAGDNRLIKKPQDFVQHHFTSGQDANMENIPLVTVHHFPDGLHTLLLEQKLDYFSVLVKHSCQEGSPVLTVNFQQRRFP